MSEWCEKPLGTLCSIKTGKKDVNEGSPNGAYPFFTCSKDVHASDSYSFDTDAILIAGNGAVGDTKIYRGKFEAYQRTYVLDGFEEDLNFIFYVLKGSLREALSKVVSGSTMPYIRKGDLERFPISLPPLPEQKKIAHILSTVQRAIEAQERIIRTTTELKKALMHKLFTEGLHNEPQKQTEIGLIPESWEVVPLKNVAEKPQYGLTAKAEKSGVLKFLRITDITDYGVNWTTVPYCSSSKRKIDTCKLKSGDIVFARIGATTGKSYMINDPPDAVFASYLIRVRAGDNLEPGFLIQFFQSRGYWQQIDANKHTNLKKGVNGSILSELLIPLPPLDEQRKITGVFVVADEKIRIASSKRNRLQDIFRTLLHELVTAKIRVPDNSRGGSGYPRK